MLSRVLIALVPASVVGTATRFREMIEKALARRHLLRS